MANDKAFKIKNGLSATRYLQTSGTVTDGSAGHSLVGAVYDNKSFDHSSDAGIVLGMYMKSDGTKMYLSSSGSGTYTDSIIEYDLSTAWDISTASYNANISVASQDTTPYGVYIADDSNDTDSYGKTMFVLGRATGSVYQYTLSTAWDVSSATYASKSFDFTTQVTLPATGFFFKSDGSIMYVMESTASDNVNVYQYNLTTSWDVSSAVYSGNIYAINDGLSASLFFTSDGKEMYHNVYSNASGSQDIVRKHTLSTAWDISTASVSSETLDVSGQDTSPYSLWFKPDGSKLYVGGISNDKVFQYSTTQDKQTLDLSTGNYFSYTLTDNTKIELSNPPASGKAYAAQIEVTGGAPGYDISSANYDSKSFSVGTQDASPIGLTVLDDGTKFYVTGNSNDTIFQYSMSTAHDISTASYDSKSLDVSGQDVSPKEISFNSDGTKMYLLGDVGNDINQYTLTTAYDISTASFDSVTASLNSSDSYFGLHFKPDGTEFYVLNATADTVEQYSLTTAFDLSTVSYTTNFSVSSQDTGPEAISLSNDGTKLFVVGSANETIFQYSLSTAWDLSTASYSSVSFDISSQDTDAKGISFSNSGKVMYIVGPTNDTIYQYSTTGAIYTITWPDSIKWDLGVAPAAPAIGNTDLHAIFTVDGGTTYYGAKTAGDFS